MKKGAAFGFTLIGKTSASGFESCSTKFFLGTNFVLHFLYSVVDVSGFVAVVFWIEIGVLVQKCCCDYHPAHAVQAVYETNVST